MPTENNVAAQAGDSEPRERSPYVLGVKPSTWDAQVAAQAGDEPMPDDVIPVRLPSGGKAVVRLPRPFTLADGVHLMNFLESYIEEKTATTKPGA